MKVINRLIALIGLFFLIAIMPVYAMIPVIDAGAIAEAVKQFEAMGKQLAKMEDQLKAIKGDRGMGSIGIESNRNYLPSDWDAALHLLDQSNPYTDITRSAERIRDQQAILTPSEVGKLPIDVQDYLKKTRNMNASQQALGQAAYQKASQRITILQQLVDKVSQAEDAKAAMDLQSRIQSEQAMLQNESIKLANLQQLQQAQAIAEQTRQDEMRIQVTGSGNFPNIR